MQEDLFPTYFETMMRTAFYHKDPTTLEQKAHESTELFLTE